MKQRVLVASSPSATLGSILASKLGKREGSGPVVLGVSGGSAATVLIDALKSKPGLDLSHVKIVMCDERLVPKHDAESSFRLYKEQLVDPHLANLTLDNFVQVNVDKEASTAADEYEESLRALDKDVWPPKLTLAILGMGPDGHTCSLFPGHRLLEERERVVSWLDDSPKPPPCRITLTFRALEHAETCVFVCGGGSKASVLKTILEENNKDNFPAGMVRPKEELVWILDEASAAQLDSKTFQKA